MPENKKTLYLLDAYALIYRSFFAFSQAQMYNSKGFNTSCVYGFTSTLVDVLNKHNPSHIAVVFDTDKPTERHTAFPEYKANREAMPDDIRKSIPVIKKIIEAFEIPILYSDGYEADDVIGTLAKKAEKEGYITYMMTPDKDFGQLVTENIMMYKPARMGNKAEIWGIKEVCAKFEVESPIQVIDYLGMCGDNVDNIPGIAGVGDKTAKKFLKQYGSVEKLLENIHELKGKMKEKVEKSRDNALLSKKLATIITDVPIEFEPKKLQRDPMNKEALEEIFAEMEFRALSRRILGSELKTTSSESTQGDLFSQEANTEVELEEEVVHVKKMDNISTVQHLYHLIERKEERAKLLKTLKNSSFYCFDTETNSVDPLDAELVGIAFSIKKAEAYYVSFPEDQEQAKQIMEEFRPLFEDSSKEVIAQNVKYDLIVLRNYGIELKGRLFCTMIAHYLLQPDMKHNMDILAENYLNYRPVPIESLIGKKGKKQGNMRDIDPKAITEYAGEDADITLQLKEIFEPQLKENKVEKLFRKIEMPLIPVLAEMEREGINLDVTTLKKFSKELDGELLRLSEKILEIAGTSFNIDSPKQLGEVLFDVLKIDEKAKKTRTGQYSTSEDILSRLAPKNEIVQLILEYRSIKKLKSTYVDALPALINKKTNRLHTNYMQTVASTGRLSSTNPNLQNIPVKTEKGREMRKAFIPRSDEYFLLASDYSQIELRIMAALSEDESMIKAFKDNIDIHSVTASKVFGVDIDEVDREMRRKAKMVNFGIIYGISPFGLSQRLDIPRKEAAEIINSYFSSYPKIKEYMNSNIEFARKNGFVETIKERRRYLPNINGRNAIVRGYDERNAINAPIQGSAADIIKISMIQIQEEFKKNRFKSKLLLQVHDELVFDVHKDEVELVKPIIKDKMENAVELKVPLVVEMKAAKNWLDAH